MFSFESLCTEYLYKYGFDVIKTVHTSNQVITWATQHGYKGELLTTAKQLCDEALEAFSLVDDKLDKKQTNKAEKKKEALRNTVKELVKDCGYTEEIVFEADELFNRDPVINEYYQFDWS